MKILGIETSCDETAVCLIDAWGDFNNNFRYEVLGNTLISQAQIHSKYGGVFPNLAKREHAKNLVPILERTLAESKMLHKQYTNIAAHEDSLKNILEREPELCEKLSEFLKNHTRPHIDCIAVTVGPGLEPALWVGINFARALTEIWNIPVVAINHMEGHVVISAMDNGRLADFEFPALALLISGGHTELVLAREWMKYEIQGETRDDAVGEAFDKVARLLDLPYPGGPEISRLASEARENSVSSDFKLPRPMLHDDNLDFSFAGLKTAVRRIVETNSPLSQEMKLGISREFEDAVADVLAHKTLHAVDAHGVNTVIVGGGVSANTYIKKRLNDALTEEGYPAKLLIPAPELATDNALMIALAGYFHAKNRDFINPDMLKADGNLRL